MQSVCLSAFTSLDFNPLSLILYIVYCIVMYLVVNVLLEYNAERQNTLLTLLLTKPIRTAIYICLCIYVMLLWCP